MKLYATISSERASKGQGGEKHIRVALKVGSKEKSRTIATVTLLALGKLYELWYHDGEKDETRALQSGEI